MRTARRLLAGLAVVVALGALDPRRTVLADEAAGQTDERLRQLTNAFATFEGVDLHGRRWAARGLAGQVVVIDFWASWCAPCLADVPWLRRLHERGARGGTQVIGVSLDVSDRRTLMAWLNRHRVDWPQIWEDRGYEGRLARQFGVTSLPTSILVGADGRVVAVGLRGDRLLAAVDTLLAGRSYSRTAAP